MSKSKIKRTFCKKGSPSVVSHAMDSHIGERVLQPRSVAESLPSFDTCWTHEISSVGTTPFCAPDEQTRGLGSCFDSLLGLDLSRFGNN